MPSLRVLARNALSNWIALAANVGVTLVLTPAVVRELGAAQYGVWVLLSSVTGYLGLVEAGVTASTGRFLNYHIGRRDLPQAAATVNAALLLYLLLGAAFLSLVGLIGPLIFPLDKPVFGLRAIDLLIIILLLVLNVTGVFVSAVYGQLLQAENRFDLRNLAVVFGVLLRLFVTIPALEMGGGLLALAWIQLGSTLMSLLLLVWLTRCYGAKLTSALGRVNRQAFGELFGFGKWALLNNVSSKIDQQTSIVIVGVFFRPAAVAHYGVAQMLVEYGLTLVQSVIAVAAPDLNKKAGEGDVIAVRKFIDDGARFSAYLGVPLLGGVAVFGMDFIRLWLGPEFLAASGVLVILAFAKTLCLVSQSLGMSIWAMGKITLPALTNFAGSVGGLCVSIFLVVIFRMDFEAVAIGICVAMFIQHLVVLPWLGQRLLDVGCMWFFRHCVLRFILIAFVALPLLLVIRYAWPIRGWVDLFLVFILFSVLYLPIGGVALWGVNGLRGFFVLCTRGVWRFPS